MRSEQSGMIEASFVPAPRIAALPGGGCRRVRRSFLPGVMAASTLFWSLAAVAAARFAA